MIKIFGHLKKIKKNIKNSQPPVPAGIELNQMIP